MRKRLTLFIFLSTIFFAHFGYAKTVALPCDTKICGAGMDCVDETVQVCVCEEPKPGDTEDPACDCSGTALEARCVQKECDSNADCGEAAVCIVYEDDGCGGGRPMVECPADNPDCDDFETPVCSPSSTQYCVPQYLASCLGDVDCGPGFFCAHLDPESEEGHCDLVPTDCMDDSECQEGNSCLQQQCGTGSGWCKDMFTDASYCVPPGFLGWNGRLGDRVDPIQGKRKSLFGCSTLRPNSFGPYLIFAAFFFYRRKRKQRCQK